MKTLLELPAVDKRGSLTFVSHDLRRLTIDPDLAAVCLFAALGLTSALLAFIWATSAEAWVDAVANQLEVSLRAQVLL